MTSRLVTETPFDERLCADRNGFGFFAEKVWVIPS
jgi:hypothetical protein